MINKNLKKKYKNKFVKDVLEARKEVEKGKFLKGDLDELVGKLKTIGQR